MALYFYGAPDDPSVLKKNDRIHMQSKQTGHVLQVIKGSVREDSGNFETVLSDREFSISAMISGQRIQQWERTHSDQFARNVSGTILRILKVELVLELSAKGADENRLLLNILDFKTLGCQGEATFGRPIPITSIPLSQKLISACGLWIQLKETQADPSSRWQFVRDSILKTFLDSSAEQDPVEVVSEHLFEDNRAAAESRTLPTADQPVTRQMSDTADARPSGADNFSLSDRPAGATTANDDQKHTQSQNNSGVTGHPKDIHRASTRHHNMGASLSIYKDKQQRIDDSWSTTYTRRDAKISAEQAKLLKPADGPWIPAPPGGRAPVANMVNIFLEEIINVRAKRRPAEPEEFNEAEGVERVEEESQRTIWPNSDEWASSVESSPVPKTTARKRSLPPDSEDEDQEPLRQYHGNVEASRKSSTEPLQEPLNEQDTQTESSRKEWIETEHAQEQQSKPRKARRTGSLPYNETPHWKDPTRRVFGSSAREAEPSPEVASPKASAVSSSAVVIVSMDPPAVPEMDTPTGAEDVSSGVVQILVTAERPIAERQIREDLSQKSLPDPAISMKSRRRAFMAICRSKRRQEQGSIKQISQSSSLEEPVTKQQATSPSVIKSTQLRSQSEPITPVVLPSPPDGTSAQSLPGDGSFPDRGQGFLGELERYDAELLRGLMPKRRRIDNWRETSQREPEYALSVPATPNTNTPARKSSARKDSSIPPPQVIPELTKNNLMAHDDRIGKAVRAQADAVEVNADIFKKFKSVHPTYGGDRRHFYRLCWFISTLKAHRPPRYAFDHFVLCYREHYAPYVTDTLDVGETPLPYEEWYSERADRPASEMVVLTTTDVTEGAALYEKEYMTEKERQKRAGELNKESLPSSRKTKRKTSSNPKKGQGIASEIFSRFPRKQ